MLAFQNDFDCFERLNAQVLGVSPDSLATHQEFAKKHDLRFPLISDPKGDLQKMYASGGVTFIVDKTGTIRFIQKGTPDNEALLRELALLVAE